MSNARIWMAEAVGTCALLAIVVGSGIMGAKLSAGNVAIALLANAFATGFGLFVLIAIFAPVSGAHFNPLVSVLALLDKTIDVSTFAGYMTAQIAAAIAGTWLAHAMFDVSVFEWGTQRRVGGAQLLSEMIATTGLVLTIRGSCGKRVEAVAAAVGAYIAAAYWFTASTSFANPAVTIARSLTTTFAGIAPVDVPMFLGAQCAGAALGYVLSRYLWPRNSLPPQTV